MYTIDTSPFAGMPSQTPVNPIVEIPFITDTKEVDKITEDVSVTVPYVFFFMISHLVFNNGKLCMLLFLSLKKKTMCTTSLMSQTR